MKAKEKVEAILSQIRPTLDFVNKHKGSIEISQAEERGYFFMIDIDKVDEIYRTIKQLKQ